MGRGGVDVVALIIRFHQREITPSPSTSYPLSLPLSSSSLQRKEKERKKKKKKKKRRRRKKKKKKKASASLGRSNFLAEWDCVFEVIRRSRFLKQTRGCREILLRKWKQPRLKSSGRFVWRRTGKLLGEPSFGQSQLAREESSAITQ